jgi:hypothetical protein
LIIGAGGAFKDVLQELVNEAIASLVTSFDIVGWLVTAMISIKLPADHICCPGVIVNCWSITPSHVNGADFGWSAVAQTIKS